jgi:hypothetical protein
MCSQGEALQAVSFRSSSYMIGHNPVLEGGQSLW